MKKIFLLGIVSMITITLLGQDRYIKEMEKHLVGFDSVRSVAVLIEKANAFERIAEAEKNKWLPYYFAALSTVNLGYTFTFGSTGGNTAKSDPLADKAEDLLNKADSLDPNNSEIYLVRKMIATLRMLGDVMNRFMTEGKIASDALAMAKKLNPENPRVYVMEGIDFFNTPEQFGGNKARAKELFEEAFMKFDSYKPASSIHPDWGRGRTSYFLSQFKTGTGKSN